MVFVSNVGCWLLADGLLCAISIPQFDSLVLMLNSFKKGINPICNMLTVACFPSDLKNKYFQNLI